MMSGGSRTSRLLERILAQGEMSLWQLAALAFHLPSFIKLYWRLFTDSRVPLFPAKAFLGAALAYVISPVDLLPELLLPMFGFAEDAVILLVALQKFILLCPHHLVMEHVARIEEEQRKPKT